MRQPERIPIFLNSKKVKLYIEHLVNEINKSLDDINLRLTKPFTIVSQRTVYSRYVKRSKELKKYWKKHPNDRFVQVLINTGIIGNYPGMYYYEEEMDWLIENSKKYELPNILLWTSVLDKDGKLLKKVSVKPLSKLTKQHLKNIFADYLTGKQVLPKHYKETIEWMIEKDYL